MYESFFRTLNDKLPFTMEEQEIIKSYLTPKKLRKRQYLLQEGDVCKFVAYVETGVLRQYTIGLKGVEHIVQFAVEGWTISDLYSFTTGEPATYSIDAVEDAELVLITRSAQDEIYKRVPRYESYIRMQFTGAYLAMQKRVTSMISLSPEERYTNFTRLYLNIVQHVPQHMIASYLGLTPETLSRIRRKMSAQK